MFLNNDIATYLNGLHTSLEDRVFAGSGSFVNDDPNEFYVVVDGDILIDNGEHSTGVLATKVSLVQINFHAKTDISVLATAVDQVKTALAVRQFAITEHWLQGCFLQSQSNYDLKNDPQGREEGIPDIVLSYKVGWRRIGGGAEEP